LVNAPVNQTNLGHQTDQLGPVKAGLEKTFLNNFASKWLRTIFFMAGLVLALSAVSGCLWSQTEPEANSTNNPYQASALGELRPAGEEQFLHQDFKAAKPLLTAAGRAGSLRAVIFLRLISEYGLDSSAPNPDEAHRFLSLLAASRERLTNLAENGPASDRPIYLTALAVLYLRGYFPEGPSQAQALQAARKAAASNFVPAKNVLAAAILGLGPEKSSPSVLNRLEAYQALQSAADAGDVLAMSNLSYVIRLGLGTSTSPFRAASWAHRAASLPQTSARCLNDLGFFYEQGLAVSPDPAEAARWYGLAAVRGYSLAISNLNRIKSSQKGTPEVFDGLEY
jgi:hypothetical protein